MRSGPLSLPSISTSILPSTSDIDSQARDQREEELLCETYLENAAEVVRVLPAKKVVRAMIPLVNASMASEYRRDDWGVVA